MKVQKCACQISSELAARKARYGDLYGRVKNRSFQAATIARISRCSLYAGDIGLMHSSEPVRRVCTGVGNGGGGGLGGQTPTRMTQEYCKKKIPQKFLGKKNLDKK